MGKGLIALILLAGCTTTKKQPPIYVCYAYDEPGIIAWGDDEKQAEENMRLVNCDLKPGADCSNRTCDKFEVL